MNIPQLDSFLPRTNGKISLPHKMSPWRYLFRKPAGFCQNKKRKGLPMTICAAAICKQGMNDVIVGVSDRMLTCEVGEVAQLEYETKAWTKIYGLHPADAVVLVAGDVDNHASIVTETHEYVEKKHIKRIKSIARLYAENFAKHRKAIIQDLYFSPLGLSIDKFVTQQRKMNQDLVLELADKLLNEQVGVEAIIAGIDLGGAHIYHVGDPGHEKCFDASGFHAIGGGAIQFTTQMMLMGYDRFWQLPESLHLIYSGKKKAEVAPGVGQHATDLWMLGTNADGLLPEEVIIALHDNYREFEARIEAERNNSIERLRNDSRMSMIWKNGKTKK